ILFNRHPEGVYFTNLRANRVSQLSNPTPNGPSVVEQIIQIDENHFLPVFPDNTRVLFNTDNSTYIPTSHSVGEPIYAYENGLITMRKDGIWKESSSSTRQKSQIPFLRRPVATQFDDQSIAIGHQYGLVVYQPAGNYAYTIPELDSTFITCLESIETSLIAAADSDGNIILIDMPSVDLPTSTTSENGHRPVIQKSFNELGVISDMEYDKKRRSLWVSTFDGLHQILLDEDEIISFGSKDGLESTNLKSLLLDLNGNLWLSSNKGIFNFSPDENSQSPKFYFSDQSSSISSDFTMSVAQAMPNGKLLFAGNRGIDIIDPIALDSFYNPPTLLLREIRVLDIPYTDYDLSSQGAITLPYNQNTLSFELAAPEYTDPKRVEYVVFLVDGQGDTTEIPLGTSSTFELFNQPPDNYRFGFTAKSAQGVWAEDPYWMSINIRPHWSQTAWFRLLLLVMGVSLAALITRVYYRYKLRVQEAQQAEERRLADLREAELKRRIDLEEQRRQITARIHNEVGGNLTTISMLSSRIDKAKELDKTKTLNERITQRVRETRRRFSSFLRAINPQFDELNKTLQLVRSDTAEMLRDNAMHASFEWPDTIPDFRVSPDFRLGFFEMVREIVNNIMKSASANHLHLVLKLPDHERLELSILDDGDGFVPSEEDFTKGIGLSSLQRISQELGGTLTYELRSEGGTKTHISLPLPNASNTNKS
ncbi:MAG: ATP-binding protein, partial [Bacteroidota bacterium]